MDASGIIARHQEIEFKALEGSLSMMSKVLNDVLDFNRMDSGRFESVLRPYCFHKVMHSLFIPLKLATDARKLQFITILDPDIDKVARIALHESLGESEEEIEKRLGEHPEESGIVVGDETRLRQIITNLASNACKFTPTGGTLTIRTQLVVPCQRCKSDHEYGCEMDEAEVEEVEDQDQDLKERDQDQDQREDDEKSPSRVASPLPLNGNGDHLDITPVDEKGEGDEKTPEASAEKQQQKRRDAKCRHHHHRHHHQHHHYNPAPRQYRVYEDGEEREVEVDRDAEEGEGEERDPMSVLSRNHLTQHNSIHGKPPPPLEWIVVRIEVSDTGCGIRPKDMVESKLFSAFNQTEAGRQQGGKGTGLGLALVRQIVKLSGGRLGLRSKVHEGSTFWVELPLGVGTKAIPGMAVAHLPPSEAELILSRTSELVKKEDLKEKGAGDTVKGEVQAEGGNDEKADVASPSSSQTVVPTGSSPTSPSPRTVIGLSHMASRSSSALHSIMEQGGLVEISTKRGESSVPTRTIGDPSTGTDLTEPPKDDPSPSPTPADRLSCKDQSLETIRPSHVELPKPQRFSIDDLPDGQLDASISTTGTGNENGNGAGTGSAASASVSSTHSTSLSPGYDPAFAGLRVLVVDDDPLTRKLMSRLLTRLGCRVSTAENGEVALEKILGGAPSRATPSSEDTGSGGLMEVATTVLTPQDEARYNLVFLDNQMPVMSGLDTVRRLRAMGRNDFVVGVTGNALLTDQEEYLNTGVDHVLTKPVFEKSIKAMLKIANERRKLRGALGSEKLEPPPSPSSPTSPTVPDSPTP
ncbi:hypothetical protein NLI96_g6565 [Meripilus lineatus]|uniref:histidine kinase n=1 Tax=Meripilus lineatus TaxID=2056292 RepID=A0AAD5V2G9_9APHY|nr:hypothetical protein NLI96_g6565 [Physisporinus lineatus]